MESHHLISLFEHDLFGKLVSTPQQVRSRLFPDHALSIPTVSVAQIWHLLGQMAQKTCSAKQKHSATVSAPPYTEHQAVRHNVVSSAD
jgi:hypothetical protein